MIAVKKIIKRLFFLRYLYIVVLAMVVAIAYHGLWLANTPQSADSLKATPAAEANSFVSPGWHSVTIGAGGYITGFSAHPQEADLLYIRTDNGGFYRWQATQQRWLPITDYLPRGFGDYDRNSGGEALALDPQNPDLVYIAVGKYTHEPGTVYKSLDRGATWQPSDLAVPMGGNEDKRWAGNRLAVSPFDSNLLLFGSRQDGLWRSHDGGNHWTQVANLSIDRDNYLGILAIAFDPQQANLVYASVYGDGVYQSQDRGVTWHKLANSPRKVMQMEVARNSVLYATSSESPQVSKYVVDKWVEITPKGFVHHTFNGLSLHPQAEDTLIVSEGEKGKAKIYYSADGGANWVIKQAVINNTVPWLAEELFNDHPSAIAFDPHNPQRVWLTDWFSVWRTDNIQSKTVEWTNQIAGIEQTVLFSLSSPPKGAILLSGIADQDGFYHHNLNEHPHNRFGFQRKGSSLSSWNLTGDRHIDDYFQDTLDIAYCQNSPQNLVRVGGQRWRDTYMGANSSDGGLSWQPWTNMPQNKLFMRVAISPRNPQHFVVTTSEDRPLVTQDGGITWQEVSGLPNGEKGPWNWNQPLAADGAKVEQFYYYDSGKFYRSDDGGLSFQATTQDLPQAEKYILTNVPGVAEELWLSLDQGGLYYSQNGGFSFNKIESVEQAHLVTIGTSITNKLPHSIYVYGTLKNNQSGLFMSLDLGNNWQQINQMPEIPRSIKVLVASQQIPGLIFAGTDGRGIHYQLIKASQLNLAK